MAPAKTEPKRTRVREQPAGSKTARHALPKWKTLTFGTLFIFLLTLVIYSPVIRGGFLWDDLPIYLEGSIVPSPQGLETIWLKSVWLTNDFPLTVTTFWLEYQLWGKDPMGYHITNIVLHAFGSVLLWRLLLRLNIRGAFLIALTFAVHPVCVASVAWISERKNTLSLVFFLLSLLLFVRSEEREIRSQNSETRFRVSPVAPRLFYFGSLIAFLLALLSKTSITPLPVVLLGLAFWQRGRITTRDVLRSVPFFLLSIGFGLLTIYSQSHHAIRGDVVQTETFAARLAESAWAIWFYLWKILAPLNLSAIYPRWELQKVSPIHFVPLAALAGFLFWFWRKPKTWGRHALFAFGFFVIMLSPVLGFIDMYFLTFSRVADHWQYAPLIGVLAFTVGGSVWLLEKYNASWQVKRLSAVALIAFLSVLTWNHAKVHASEESLWSDAVEKNPKAWIAFTHLGKVRHEQGRAEDAIALFDHSLSLKADYAETHNRKGVVLAANGKLSEAVESFATALRLAPGHAEAHRNLGAALTTTGDFSNAVKHLREYCRLKPDSIDAASSLAWILATHPNPNVRNGSEAVQLAARALEQIGRPDANLMETLAAAYAESGDFANAQKVAQSGIALAKAVPDEPLAARIEFELNGYRANQPFRDPSFGGN